MLDLDSLNCHWNCNNGSFFIIGLLGKIKGEHNNRAHLIPCINTTSSGIEVKKVVQRLLVEKSILGFKNGPAISDMKGRIHAEQDMDDLLIEILEEIYNKDKTLFLPKITSRELLQDYYH